MTKHYHFKDSNTYEIPAGKEWKIGLLSSLLEIQDGKWMISFDEEGEGITEDEVKLMIDDVCKNEVGLAPAPNDWHFYNITLNVSPIGYHART